mmetsp:Transcript_12249/g.29492  ORF Transcript_12249/g.29492 Transcript_12249/m.29492 type:complete len:130 (+) Transcript_12249:69-458(+)
MAPKRARKQSKTDSDSNDQSNSTGGKRSRKKSGSKKIGSDDHQNDNNTEEDFQEEEEQQQKEKALRAFALFDEVGKGCVVLEDLQRISEELGEGFTEDQLEEMLVFADRKGEGLLQPKNFVRIARQVNL